MASEVFSGSSNFSYKNNTGQNVRVVINYMASANNVGASNIFGESDSRGRGRGIALTWAGVSINSTLLAIGRNLATSYIDIEDAPNTPVYATPQSSQLDSIATYSSYGVVHNNNAIAVPNIVEPSYTTGPGGNLASGLKITGSGALPTEIMLRPGQTFSATCGVYNVVVIPENG